MDHPEDEASTASRPIPAHGPVVSCGTSGIGFVNFGTVKNFVAEAEVVTHGSIGNTLVKGVNLQLPAEAFSVKPGGVVEKLVVRGDLATHGAKVSIFAVEGGKVIAIDLKGKVLAYGQGSNAVLVADKGSTPLTNLHARAKNGQALVEAGGDITDRVGFAAE